MNRALVRAPGPRLTEGLVSHIERVPVDLERAVEQWQGYVATLAGLGWEITEIEPADDCPDAVFIEDTLVVFDSLVVVTSPGAPERRGEIPGAAMVAPELGRDVASIEGDGRLDGGDVLKVGRTVYVGQGGRTNGEGIRQLRALLAPRGYDVVGVPVTTALHLKSVVTALPDGTVVGHPPLVEHPGLYARFLPVPEESGSHVVVIDPTTVLMASDAPRSAALYRSLGYRTIEVDIAEFQKLEGCVTCLSVRIRD